MSSHHFVVDKQEPALIIANGSVCSSEIYFPLLEWNPFIITLDGALNFAVSNAIKIDLAIGDFDSIDTKLLINNALVGEHLHIVNQNNTDLDKALEYLIENEYNAVHIINATGKRLDHTLNNILSIAKYSNQIDICLHDNYSKMFVLPKKFKKHYPKDTLLSIIPITDCENIITKGLKYNFKKENILVPQKTGSSNFVEKAGFVEITHTNGILVLIECTE